MTANMHRRAFLAGSATALAAAALPVAATAAPAVQIATRKVVDANPVLDFVQLFADGDKSSWIGHKLEVAANKLLEEHEGPVSHRLIIVKLDAVLREEGRKGMLRENLVVFNETINFPGRVHYPDLLRADVWVRHDCFPRSTVHSIFFPAERIDHPWLVG